MADVVGSGKLIRQRAEACQKVVEDALENKTGVKDFLEKLREVSATCQGTVPNCLTLQ